MFSIIAWPSTFLIVACFIAFLIALGMRKYKSAYAFLAVSVTIFILFFGYYVTSIPGYLGIIKMPTIQFVDLKTVNDRVVMEFVADKDLENFSNHGFLLYLGGSNEKSITYTDRLNKPESITIWSYDVNLKTNIENEYHYEAVIYLKNPVPKMNDSIYCRVFMLGYIGPCYETNVISVSSESLLEMLNEVKTETPF
ncbi:hypothetical protein [Bacteroides sp. 224]|uniref:hypothetical protein n=1 Tax=Bacteroides sp. 224 TaxID=2302936 RepID=UPI0013D85376|nr:hypothetical protein [Bacteroides sp. 224]NDV65076.1 hypothetical protein [Bacteroides sp. 224]